MPRPQVIITRSTRSDTLASGVLGLYFCMRFPPRKLRMRSLRESIPFFSYLNSINQRTQKRLQRAAAHRIERAAERRRNFCIDGP